MTGIIIKGIGGFYYIQGESSLIECKARGIFRKKGISPMIGDKVEISVKNGKGSIDEIYERKNFLIRPPVANIDILAVVAACRNPDPDMTLIDKMLVNAEEKNIEPIICINKTDIGSDKEITDIYKNTGYKIFSLSAAEEKGTDELMAYIKNKVTAFSGVSGVGKSSIMNIITENIMETGDISKINRGKHTTRHIELMPLTGGGYVLDTPGFSSLEISVKADRLFEYFPEMRGRICRFRGCSHISEPDCGVKEALERGEISESRYESYRQLYEIAKNIKEWQ